MYLLVKVRSKEKERGEVGEDEPAENKSWFFGGGWRWVERQLKRVLTSPRHKTVTIARIWGG
jgi:hypothetical protein